MKKLIFALALFAILLSCKNDVPAPPTSMPAVPVPAAPSHTPPATPPSVPQIQSHEGSGNSVSAAKDGVDVAASKAKVTVDAQGTSVNVKR